MTQPATSLQAWDDHKASGKVERNRRLILAVLQKYGPLTAYEIAGKWEAVGLVDYVEVNRRLSELRNSGDVERLALRGPAPSGMTKGYKHRIIVKQEQ